MLIRTIICILLIIITSNCTIAQQNNGQMTGGSDFNPSKAIGTAQPTKSVSDSGPKLSELMDTELADVNNGDHFKLSDYHGNVILVEGIATWCPTCFKESRTIKSLHTKYPQNSGFIGVSLVLDMQEDPATIKSYTQQFGFDWKFSIAPLAVSHYMGNKFGALYLDPTLVPMIIIDRQGNPHPLNLGYKSEAELQAALDPFIKSSAD
jgi:thiol-disulfide isomerase/thioredoxin